MIGHIHYPWDEESLLMEKYKQALYITYTLSWMFRYPPLLVIHVYVYVYTLPINHLSIISIIYLSITYISI